MNINKTKKLIASINQKKVEIIAVSKYQSDEDVDSLIELGITSFGENTEQNLTRRCSKFPNVNWHFIGRIQSNKIKKIVKSATIIHSAAEYRHILKINDEAKKIEKIQDILIQINIANEASKAGITVAEIADLLVSCKQLEHINVRGFMVIGDHTDNQKLINDTFKKAHELYTQYQKQYDLDILSMGMSNDYLTAIDNGSTHLRLGSVLFTD